MSTTTALEGPQAHADRLLPLIKEYAEKSNDLVEKALVHWKSTSYGGGSLTDHAKRDDVLGYYVQRWRKLHPPVKALIQQGSQLVEHGKIDDFSKLELRLRLAELEQSYLTAENLFAAVPAAIRHGIGP